MVELVVAPDGEPVVIVEVPGPFDAGVFAMNPADAPGITLVLVVLPAAFPATGEFVAPAPPCTVIFGIATVVTVCPLESNA